MLRAMGIRLDHSSKTQIDHQIHKFSGGGLLILHITVQHLFEVLLQHTIQIMNYAIYYMSL